ncbi:MAG: amidase [Bryobacteraceae bacterium]|nr:amidase [Bryobacteraceae bacterium]MDW8377869.1 amidase [Bryobacterales bacterium]
MATFGDDLYFAPITELHAGIRAKRYSSVELTRAFCDRLEKLGPRFNALALLLRDQAIRKAHDADGEILRGRIRSPLQGVPYAVKDLVAVAGHPTTWGARPYAAQVFEQDASIVKRLSKVGAVLIGKLAMVELAGGGGYRFAAASLQGPGLNPWDRSRWSGGSSSGSGSAVAAGLVPWAIGSETSGSILTPAAFCGITGLRPTYGLVSRAGCMALSWTLDKIGPMARSAEDCGHILQAISGGDSEDPSSANKRFYYAPQFAPPLKELKVGYDPADFSDRVVAEARKAFAEALEVIRQLGVRLIEAKIPDFPYSAMVATIISAEMGSIFEDLVASGKVDQLADKRQIAGIKVSQEVLAKDYLRAMRLRRLVQREFAKLFFDLDVLIAPARSGPASKISEPLDRLTSPPTPLIPAGNLAGLPALCLPCGFVDNLPLGLQIVGPPFSENKLLALGTAFQNQTNWHRRRPPV